MQGRISADGHIRAEHIVVNRAYQAGDHQVWMLSGYQRTDLPFFYQFN